jgi:hypothetical protein
MANATHYIAVPEKDSDNIFNYSYFRKSAASSDELVMS